MPKLASDIYKVHNDGDLKEMKEIMTKMMTKEVNDSGSGEIKLEELEGI